ncbi:MAG: DNA helicase RecG, partial [Nitrospirae bacterium]|nr:DNA helicase RecG [Nitrospirota bacterium]
MPETNLSNIDITSIKGIGAHSAKMLSTLGIKSISDAVYYLPYRYEDRSRLKKIQDLICGENETVSGTIVSAQTIKTPKRGLKIFTLTIRDDTGMFSAKWFN